LAQEFASRVPNSGSGGSSGSNTTANNNNNVLNRRSRLETNADILRAIAEGAEKPTHIMYKANLSWSVMQGYIKALEEQSLIVSRETDGRRHYELTEKGLRVLNAFLAVRRELDLQNLPPNQNDAVDRSQMM
jgi:predicted transcriptional regulator